MEQEQPLWQLNSISKAGFKSQRLKELSLAIPQGITAIAGQSGAGKTTLLNILSRQEMPDSGQIVSYLAKDLCPFFIVPQDFGLWPHLSVIDHLIKAMPESSKTKAEKLLEEFDLKHKANEYIEFLSQGECSRLSVARAIATNTKVLIMDEPLANVDCGRKEKYWQAILNFVEENNSSLIFSSHDSSEILAYAQNMIGLHQGELNTFGPVPDMYNNPPNPEAAALLGPGNWLKENNILELTKGFYRPEQISIEHSPNSQLSVVESRFFGGYHQSRISNGEDSLLIYHRPSDKIRAGLKVILSILIILMVSCSPSTEALNFSTVSSWNIPAAGKRLPGPRAITCGQNNEVIVLDDAGRLLVYDNKGNLKKFWNMPETHLGHPEGVTVFKDGKIAVADTHYARIVVFNADGSEAFRFGSRGDAPGQFYSPVGITLDQDENIYVCEYGFNDRIQKFSKDGKFICSFGKSGVETGNLQRASDMVWHDGLLYVADAVNNRVQVFKDNGDFQTVLKDNSTELPLYLPYDIDLGPEGNLWIIEYANCRLTKTTLSGKILGSFGTPGTEVNQFKNPWGLAVSNDGTIYVADTANRRIILLKK